MPSHVAQIKITGNVTEAIAALDRLGIRTAEVGKETEEKLGGAASRTGGVFSKLGNTLGNWGVPFSDALSKVGDKMKELEKEGAGTKAKLAEVGKVVTLATAAGLAAVSAESVKLGENYQQATAKIAASSGTSIAAAKAIGDQFLKTGFNSTFSAQEIATAYGGVAGQLKATQGHALSASQAMQTMQAAMDLSEATGSSLNDTTSALAATIQAYGLKTGDAAKAADQLYNVSVITNQPILALSQVLDRLKGRLGALAPSLQDVGTLMAFPAVAAQGSRGAMVVNTALTTLLGGSKNVEKQLKSLGVSIFNSSGKFIGMRGVIAELGPKLAHMSDAQRMLAEKTLFGASAAQLMGTIIKGGVDGYDKAAKAVEKTGTAQKGAEKQSSTLHGQTEKLKAGMEDLGVRLGSWLIPRLEELAQVVGNVIGFFERHREITLAVAAVIGGVLLGAVIAYTAAMIPAAAATIAAAAPFIAIGVAIAAVVVAVIELVKHWTVVWAAIKSVAKAAWDDVLKPVFGWIKTIAIDPIKLEIQGLEIVWSGAWDGIKSVLNIAWGIIKQIFGFIKTVAIDPIQSAISTLGGVWGTVWGGIQSAIQAAWTIIKKVIGWIQTAINDTIGLINKVIGAVTSIPGLFTGNGPDKGGNGDYTIKGGAAALSNLPDLSKLNLGNLSKLGNLSGLGGYASGKAFGGFVSDGWFATGERGPEVGYKSGSQVQIFSNGSPQTAQMLNGPQGGGNVINNIQMYGLTPDPNQLATELDWHLRKYVQ